MTSQWEFHAVGRRKTSVARVWMKTGSGQILINDRPMEQYFTRKALQLIIKQPLELTQTKERFDFKVNVQGGGISGQAGAIRHGITRALVKALPDLRLVLKKAGFITRDDRAVERKKYGQRKARARFQYSKR
jgi:small subunit ribosomal protein S9